MRNNGSRNDFVAHDGEVFHPVTITDRIAAAAMRVAAAPMKGKMNGPAARGPFDTVMRLVPEASGIRYESTTLGGVSGIMCEPADARPGKAILYFHGGAYVIGSADAYQHFGGQIAARTNVKTFLADYRRAPEAPFPAAVDDAKAVYRALIESGTRTVAIAGDSAGGGLALSLLSSVQEAVNAGELVAPCAGVVISPWADLALTGASMEVRAKADPLVTKEMLATTAELYLRGHDAKDPLASPLYASMQGLPPIQLHVGFDEVLLDDARRYVERARREQVDATLHVWEGMMHVFASNIGKLAAADAAVQLACAFLAEKLDTHALASV